MQEHPELSSRISALQVSPPDPFNFRHPEEWTKWKRRFDRYRVASGLQSQAEEIQVNALIYCMGDEAKDRSNYQKETQSSMRLFSPSLKPTSFLGGTL